MHCVSTQMKHSGHYLFFSLYDITDDQSTLFTLSAVFFTVHGSSWWLCAKNLENTNDYRLNYRLFKQKNRLSTNSRYYRHPWPPWWMLYHNLTNDKIMMWKAVSKTEDSNQREEKCDGCTTVIVWCTTFILRCTTVIMLCTTVILLCTTVIPQEQFHSHLRVWPSTKMIKRQVMNHENFTSSFQLFQD